MATSVITGRVTDPAGTALANIGVKCRLLPRPAYLTSTGAEMAVWMEAVSDSLGDYAFTLTETADITPADSFYEITEYIPPRYGGAVKHIVQVGAASASVFASLVSTPPSPEQNLYLTQAAADLRYAAVGASFGGSGDMQNIEPDDTMDGGNIQAYSRTDHRHAISAAVAGTIQPDDAAAEGSATSFSRSDHKHAIVAAIPSGVTASAAGSEGSSTSFSRADHVHLMPSAGLTITGGLLTLGPIDGTNAGASMVLKGALNGAGTDWPDWTVVVTTDMFQLNSAGVTYVQIDPDAANVTFLRGNLQIGGNLYPQNQVTYYYGLVTNQGGMPYASNAPILVGQTGWAFYSGDVSSYRMGFRGVVGGTRYMWCADYVLFGVQPSDATATHNLRVVGTVYFSGLLEAAGAISATGVIQCNSQLRSNYSTQGSALYDNANFYANGPNGTGGVTAMSWHPGGIAMQLRVGYNSGIMYLMDYSGGNPNTLYAYIAAPSMRKYKQDIQPWPPEPTPGLAFATAGVEPPAAFTALDKVNAMQPSKFHLKRDAALAQLRHDQPDDIGPRQETVHECGVDCDYTPANPCPRVQDWETGKIGLIVEDVFTIMPEVCVIGNDGPEGLDTMALVTVCLAAIKELTQQVEALRGNPNPDR